MSSGATSPEFRLVRDWDVAIEPPSDRLSGGHFVGRTRELNLLANDVLRSPQRSILISGYRGVGKTSLVYKALAEVEAKKGDREYLFVLLNAAQLEAEAAEEHEILPEQILKNLIRRLYTASKESGLNHPTKRRIAALYKKAVAKEFAEREEWRHELAESELREVLRTAALSIHTAVTWSASILLAALLAVTHPIDAAFLSLRTSTPAGGAYTARD